MVCVAAKLQWPMHLFLRNGLLSSKNREPYGLILQEQGAEQPEVKLFEYTVRSGRACGQLPTATTRASPLSEFSPHGLSFRMRRLESLDAENHALEGPASDFTVFAYVGV